MIVKKIKRLGNDVRLLINNTYSRIQALLNKVDRSKRFHVIGDSHTIAFLLNKYFSVYHIGPATAYNLCKKNSTTNSYNRIMKIIRKLPVNSNIILVAGEIDCRVHVYNKYMLTSDIKVRKNTYDTFDKQISNTIDRYVLLANQLKSLGMNIYILSIAPANTQTNIYKFPFFADIMTQAMIKKRFNELLKEACKLNGFIYIDLYKHVVKDDGTILQEYIADEVHLNRKSVRFVENQIV